MRLGSRFAARLDPAALERVFAGGIVAVALFIVAKSLFG
jgi:uncharacterized membrane protein YfcA